MLPVLTPLFLRFLPDFLPSFVTSYQHFTDVSVLYMGLRERPQDDGYDVAADELRRVPLRAARHDRGQWVKRIRQRIHPIIS